VDSTSSEDEALETPVTPQHKKISVGMPIHPPEGEITDLKTTEEVKGIKFTRKNTRNLNYKQSVNSL